MSIKILVLTLLIFIKLTFSYVDFNGGNHVFRVDSFLKPCSPTGNYTIQIKNLNIHIYDKKFFFDYDLLIQENIDNVVFSISFSRCSSKEALDTCSLLGHFKTGNGCKVLFAKGQVWSPMHECLDAQPGCGKNKGFYHGTNCTLDERASKFIILTKHYWRVRLEMTDKKEIKFCNMIEGYYMKKNI